MITTRPAPILGRINYPVLTQSLLQKALFVAISLFVISYSMGYKVNFSTQSIQRTGMVQLNTDLATLNPQIYFNGKKIDKGMPLRFGWLYPGTYTIRIEKDGYQTWERVVTVEENRAYNYYHLLLVYTKPHQLSMTSDWEHKLDSPSRNISGLRVNQNELWYKKELLTRTSADIKTAVWFPDDYHILFQAGNRLFLTEEDGKGTQFIAQLSSDTPVDVAYIQDGRILLINQNGKKQALELYEPMSKVIWPLSGPSAVVR